eukprot:18235-Heterococcus_DN1.PRE.1
MGVMRFGQCKLGHGFRAFNFCCSPPGEEALGFVVMQPNAKRSALGSQNPLHHDDTLQLILDLVGAGDYFFLAAVSKQFKRCCLQLPSFETLRFMEHLDSNVTVDPYTTVCSSILGSVSRLRLAVACGYPLDVQKWGLQFVAGTCDREMLNLLHEEYGMPFTETVSRGAAEVDSADILQW